MSRNPITGDALRSKPLSPEGQENWDRIFGPSTTKGAPKGELNMYEDQAYRQKFMETFKKELNLSCYTWGGKISSFADPKVEHIYSGWKLGFIQGQNEPRDSL